MLNNSKHNKSARDNNRDNKTAKDNKSASWNDKLDLEASFPFQRNPQISNQKSDFWNSFTNCCVNETDTTIIMYQPWKNN